jgi:hypothetical protein
MAIMQSPRDIEFKIVLKDRSRAIREHPMTGPSEKC